MPSRKGTYLPILMEMEHPNVLFLLDMRSMELERKEMSQLLCDFFYLQSSKVTVLANHPLPQGKIKELELKRGCDIINSTCLLLDKHWETKNVEGQSTNGSTEFYIYI